MMQLRPYQQESSDAAIAWIRRCTDPCVIDAATGAGKSLIIADVAARIHAISGKKILCTAPSKELVQQNYEKFRATGSPASIFSASIRKEMVHPVVFGTPQTIGNSLQKFGDKFAAVIIDEAHGITPTMRNIVGHMCQQNPKLRIIGLSATPYRMGTGYIFGRDEKGREVKESVEPFFHSRIFRIGARDLIDQGYLTPPVFADHESGYDTSGLVLKSNGIFDAGSVERAFEGHGRKTATIVADIVARSAGRRCCIIFAATVAHAHEVMASLPPGMCAMVTGETASGERDRILRGVKAGQLKYVVNVAVLTTGFDATLIDVVAIMRATESVGLLQQIVGRGLRLHDGKADCLILDYAENLERHCPGGDIFEPVIKIKRKGDVVPMKAVCPLCTYENEFTARKNEDGYRVDLHGNFTDLIGNPIKNAEGVTIPAHYGRRCQGVVLVVGKHVQCAYKWSHKKCHACEEENDISARYCHRCKAEIVDPNEKLREIAAAMASDPYRKQTANVRGVVMRQWPGKDGKPDTIRIDYLTDGVTISEWVRPYHHTDKGRFFEYRWARMCRDFFGTFMPTIEDVMIETENNQPRVPSSIEFHKDSGTKFYRVDKVVYETASAT